MLKDTLTIMILGIHGKVYFRNEMTCVYRLLNGTVYCHVKKDKQKEAAWKEKT